MERNHDVSPRRKRRVGRWLILVLLIAAGAFGYSLWRRPHIRVTACFAGEQIWMVRDPGVLTLTSPSRFIMRRWADGKPLWEAQAARPTGGSSPGAWELPTSSDYDSGISTFALSPSGEIFATASVQPRGVRLQTWKKGTLCGEATLPVKMPSPSLPYARYPYFSLSVDNNGRAFFLQHGAKLTVLEAGRILAERSMPFFTTLSADGRFASRFNIRKNLNELFVVRVAGGKIELTQIGTGEPVILFTNGNVMTDKGDMYTSNGKLKFPILAGYRPHNPPGGVTTAREWVGMGHRNGAIVICKPDTGDAWHLRDLTRITLLSVTAVSADGRYVLSGIHQQRSSTLQPVRKYLERFFPDLMAQRSRWAIYERPGALRLIIPVTVNTSAGRLQIGYALLSPDGRSIVVVAYPVNASWPSRFANIVFLHW